MGWNHKDKKEKKLKKTSATTVGLLLKKKNGKKSKISSPYDGDVCNAGQGEEDHTGAGGGEDT